MRRWKIKEGWVIPLVLIYTVGWLPVGILAQSLFAPGGMNSTSGAPLLIVLAVWFGPAIIGIVRGSLAFLVSLGLPIERIDKPKVRDLQAEIERLEKELGI